MGFSNQITIWTLAIASTLSVAQTDSAAVDSAAFAVVVPPSDSTKTWNVMGNVTYRGAYHYVRTRTNHGDTFVSGQDTIKHGKRYRNYFQVPGFMTEGSAYVRAESPDGRVFEFDADVTSDNWNKFYPNPVSLSYTDNYSHLTLGDFHKSEGDIYMGDLPLFGVDYTLSILRDESGTATWQVNGFFGEAQRPLLPGDRHPYLYHVWIDDGEAAAQRLAYGGSIKLTPNKISSIAVGGIYSNDEIEDPLFRDGTKASTITSDPMQETFTLFTDMGIASTSKDASLNFQAAVGRADTADVLRERAINNIFSRAALNTSSYTTLRKLMRNESVVRTLSKGELESIFGDNTTLTKQQMQDSLLTLVKKAKEIQKGYERTRDDDRALGMSWRNQNFAFCLFGNWSYKATTIRGHAKYIGEDFYSVGSSDQLSDTREFGIDIDQGLFDVWDVNLSYNVLVENAAKGSKMNLLGFGEGTVHGLAPDMDSQWFKEHELDIDRTRYTHNAGIENAFRITDAFSLRAGYGFEYKTQYRPFQLHAVYTEESKVYADDWFAPRKGKATTKYDTGDSTIEIDKERWSAYRALDGEDNIASKFEERLIKHTWSAGMTLRKGPTTVNVDAKFALRIDNSEFHDDELVKDFDFSDETWGKLGYYYGGTDYFEHKYPIVATTAFEPFQNHFTLTPRFKKYNRDDMDEAELTVSDELEIPFLQEFLVLGLNGEFRYMATTWEEENMDASEKESDFIGSASLRINHSKHFYSEWVVGAGIFYRPDNLSNEYKDVYDGLNLNYTF
ncbi:MAG: hypothetical protein II892_07855 [Fibrobacter sp.]|nr:hypothetical protein [Fibrobacter sp.]